MKFDLDEMEGTALMTLDEFTADVAARIAAAATPATSGSPA